MKIIYYSIVIALLAMFSACNDEDIPTAEFNRYEVSSMDVVPGDMKAKVTWEAVTEGSPIGYCVLWVPDNLNLSSGEMVVDKDVTSYIIPDLENDVKYTISVQAVFKGGRSGKISETCIPVTSRYPVENPLALAGDGAVKIQWSKPLSDEVTGYKIIVSPGGKIINITDPEELTSLISNLTNDTEYTFSVIAVYPQGESSSIVVKAKPGNIIPIIPSKFYAVENEEISFAYNPMGFLGDIASIQWSFGDNITSSEESPGHKYQSGGKYIVSLKVTYKNGTSQTESVDVYIIGYDLKFTLDLNPSNKGQVKGSSPVFGSNGTVYISLSGAGKLGDVYAINPDKTLKWRFAINDGLSYGAGPAVGNDGTVYVGSQDKNIYAINPDGSQKWVFTAGGAINCFPAISSTGIVYVIADDKKLYAISPSGAEIWSVALSGNSGAVSIGANGTIYAGTAEYIYAINASDGSEKWNVAAKVTEKTSFAMNGNTIYAAQKGGKGLMALSTNGNILWEYAVSGDIYTPVVGKDGAIYFAAKATNKFHAVMSNGTKKWEYTTNRASNYCAPAIDENGIIYFGSQYNSSLGSSAIFALDTNDGTLLWKLDRSDDGKIMAGASIGADKKLYVGTIGGNTEKGELLSIPIFAGPELGSWSVRGGNLSGNNRQ